MKILVINSCIRGEESRTWKLAKRFLDSIRIQSKMKGIELSLEQLNLADMPLSCLTGDFFAQREKLLAKGDLKNPRFNLAHQFAAADIIIVAAPFWDLGIPAILKVYIENISVDGITFGCDENGMYGKCKADKMVYITSRGGIYKNSPLEQGAPYLHALCRMYGISEFQTIAAEGLDDVRLDGQAIMEAALKEAEAAGISMVKHFHAADR